MFRTPEEKKSAIATILLFVLLLLVMSIAIFPPEVKPLEGGGGGGTLALNFGFDEEGMGDNYASSLPVAAAPKSSETSKSDSEILTSDNEDAVAIKETTKKDTPKKDTPKETVKDNPKTTNKVESPTPSKNVTDALSNLLGDGNSNKAGNQGKPSGKITDVGYDGSGGSGTGSGGGHGSGHGIGTGSGYGSGSGSGVGSGHGNYKLSGRKSLAMPQPQYKCNEEGTVVVEITVDKSGKVIEAKPGVRGTTNTAKCLVDVAKQAALQAKFDPSASAPDTQVGTITYNFKLKE